MARRLRIIPAATLPAAVATIAPMLCAEWQHLYPGWTPESAAEELLETGSAGSPPCSWLAFADDRIDLDEPVGSISLALDDEVDLVVDGERPGPWLAHLYVVPERREQGVATALIEHVLGHADGLGIDTLWLVTDSAPELHRRFGWTAFARTTLNSWPCIVMRRG